MRVWPVAQPRHSFPGETGRPYNPGVLESDGWSVATATYGEEEFIGAISRGNIFVLWERLELIAVQECVYGP
jgi:hypothetical protein